MKILSEAAIRNSSGIRTLSDILAIESHKNLIDHIAQSKQLRYGKESVGIQILKAYVVRNYYLSFTFEQSFRALGCVHTSYEQL